VYEALPERRAERDLKKLPAGIFDRIIPQIKALGEDPKPPGCRKITGSKNDWRIRIGQHRVIYEIDEQAKAVKVMRIRHRRQVHRQELNHDLITRVISYLRSVNSLPTPSCGPSMDPIAAFFFIHAPYALYLTPFVNQLNSWPPFFFTPAPCTRCPTPLVNQSNQWN
jgi:mRNA interferase RelE/StbE